MQRYGSSLLSFNTKVRVRVKSETPLPRGLGVKVSSEMLRSDGEAIPVDYLMRQSGGQWKVFDVMVEGVSYVQTFLQQFDQELQHTSIAQVPAELRKGTVNAVAEKSRQREQRRRHAGVRRPAAARRSVGSTTCRDSVVQIGEEAVG